ncbi:FAD binding domain-containing protein [Anaeroselena agilis]|uniref:Xanthine dehydrogenase family protein subunit M n=1 Tax=Anaeroselena agilis TaxID=3063788 RepID=A0ABU3NUL2_9FIRM|nr:xanthine dehydrogenase family protein subunit M [Selenomonadales bacterium 4137-cl]
MFEYHEPQSLAEVTSFLAAHGEAARVLAGGTDLLVQMRKGRHQPRHLLNIKTVPGLDQIVVTEHCVEIGAAVTLHDGEKFLSSHPEYGVLCQAMHSVASCQIRNRATLAGNVCNASPAADTVPALAVLGASVKVHGSRGDRLVPVERFFTGPGRTVLLTGEVVSAIVLPRINGGGRGVFLRKARRPSLDLATANVAVHGAGANYRIALGAVGPTVIRVREAERLLARQGLTAPSAAEAARIARQAARPITDVRGSEEYRLELVAALTERALLTLAGEVRA